jgi:hypothetical protein
VANKNKFKGRGNPTPTTKTDSNKSGSPVTKKGFGANPQGKTTKGKKKASY